MTNLSGWGRYPGLETQLKAALTMENARSFAASEPSLIARGNGRSYGDAAIGTQTTLSMLGVNRMRHLDEAAALITVEAGVLLAEILRSIVPRGLFLPVVPGTRFVTVGGAIASDVHGKNHHGQGGFGDYVESLKLAIADGTVLLLSRTSNPELFFATIGGMGLTGVILQATLRLIKIETGWIKQQTLVAQSLDEAITKLDASDHSTYSVAWIDCVAKGANLGRSLIFLGEHARLTDLDEKAANQKFPEIRAARLGVPFDLPKLTLNPLSIRAFNELYFHAGARKAGNPFLVPADPYFFPLDGINNWNRIYGRRGFVQHQCVIPLEKARSVLPEMMARISARGDASFLAVLKKLGPASGLLSFPMPGFTLALDFPMSSGLIPFLHELDSLVVQAGGRFYLAKDAVQSRASFEAGYGNLSAFRDIRARIDPARKFQSALAHRLGL